MTQQANTQEYSRFNEFKRQYIDAMNRKKDPEELHCYLRDLLREAIKMDVSLIDLLKILSGSAISDSDTEKFIDNVSRHYAWGVAAAKVKHDEDDARKEAIEKNKKSRR